MDGSVRAFQDRLGLRTRQVAETEVNAATSTRLHGHNGEWTVDYARLRFRVVKR